jgi:hypothetical protein
MNQDVYDPITDSSTPLDLQAKHKVEYTLDEETRLVPIVVYKNGKKINSDEWDETVFIETPFDILVLSNNEFIDKKVLVVKASDWKRGKKVETKILLKCTVCGSPNCRGECDEDRFLGLID